MDTVLLFFDNEIVSICLTKVIMNGYLRISEIDEKWGIKERRITTLCLERRIEGAVKFENTWAIPEDAEKPTDERIKSGKYIKKT